MMASLNHSSSNSSLGSALMSGTTFTALTSREALKEQGRILLLVDAQADAAPFHDVLLAGDQVFDRLDALARIPAADLDLAEMEPELARVPLRQRHGDRHGILAVDRLLDEADHFVVVDLREPQVARLQQCRIAAPDAIEPADIALDVARLV